MTEQLIVSRSAIYALVWRKIRAIADDAAPGSITPETMTRVVVDATLEELRRKGAIVPHVWEGD